MQDIIPSNNQGAKKSPKRLPKPDRVLRLEYKLPARLRKSVPGHKTRRISIQNNGNNLNFKQHSLKTNFSAKSNYHKNRREQSTNEIHNKPKQDIKIIPPPYVYKKDVREVKPPREQTSKKTVKPPNSGSKQNKKTPPLDYGLDVRDVPYQFTTKPLRKNISDEAKQSFDDQTNETTGRILQPDSIVNSLLETTRSIKHNLRSVFHFKTTKQTVINASILLFGIIIAYGLIWNLNKISGGISVMDSVQAKAQNAYGELLMASAAMADVNFKGSENNFNEAAKQLREARSELNEAMSASQKILRYVDVTGTVKSGQELLNAGEQLSQAGLHISRGMEPLIDSFGDKKFIDAIGYANNQFKQSNECLQKVEKSLADIDGTLLPKDIKKQIKQVNSVVPKVRQALDKFNDQSDLLMAMLGAKRDKKYLLLFQNNHEMRPTGGFIGSIGLVNIDRGTVEEININSVYDPDGQMRDFIAPPKQLRPITNRWYLRDANWFIDFPTSAEKIIHMLEKERGPTVDGVIALTPEVTRELLKITGPIKVPEHGVTVNYDNFWQVTSDQVSYSYDKQLNRPKKFLADLAPLLLNRLFETNGAASLDALGGLLKMVKQKHLLVYLNNDEMQQKLSALGWSGEVPLEKPGMLHVNNANIAGHKSDQFIEQNINYELELTKDGSLEATVIIKRHHRGNIEKSDYQYPQDEDPSQKNNIVFQRTLVPQGSKLLSAEGFSSRREIPQMVVPADENLLEPDKDLVSWQTGQYEHESGTTIGQEAGYTFFGNWIITSPGETSVTMYRYRLPESNRIPSLLDPAKKLEAFILKQPGDTRTNVRVELKLPEDRHIIHTAPESGITQNSGTSITYRSKLNSDILTGVVYE